jgi:uncharacterized protein YndB with AHSA1/START domain
MVSIEHLFHIAAPQEQVFQAISTLEGLRQWWTANTQGSTGVGDTLQFRFGAMGPDMKVVSLSPGAKVEWECTQGFPDWVGTRITIALDQNEGKTRVRFSHLGWKLANDPYAASNFSWGRYLESLRQFCQTGKGSPFGAA